MNLVLVSRKAGEIMSRSKEFDTDKALHGDLSAFANDPERVGLIEVLKRIPTEHRQTLFEAAIRQIAAEERRQTLHAALMDKIDAMSENEIEQFLKGTT
jgi:hypothetical protein